MFRVKFLWFADKKKRFGVKVLLFGVKFLVLRVILSKYGVTFLIKNLV